MTRQEFREMEEALRNAEQLAKLFPDASRAYENDAGDEVEYDDPASEAARDFVETYGHRLLEIARDHLKF